MGRHIGAWIKAIAVLGSAIVAAGLVEHGVPAGIADAHGHVPLKSGSTAVVGSMIFLFVGFELESGASEEMINPQRDVPIGILRSEIITLVFRVSSGGGDTLNSAMAVFLGIALSTAVLAYIFTIPATITLRRKFPDVHRPFIAPGGTFGLWIQVILAELGIILTGFTLLWPGHIDKVLGQQYSIVDSWGASRTCFELTTFGSFIVTVLIGIVFWAWGRPQTSGAGETVEELIEGAVVED